MLEIGKLYRFNNISVPLFEKYDSVVNCKDMHKKMTYCLIVNTKEHSTPLMNYEMIQAIFPNGIFWFVNSIFTLEGAISI